MKRLIVFVHVFMALALLSGCSSTPSQHGSSSAQQGSSSPHYSSQSSSQSSNPNSQPVQSVKRQASAQQLLAYYRQWQGTPYRLGGQSKRGIDCSGFVQNAYRDVLGMSVPRTTAMQAQAGVAVASTQKQVGDILLFKTGVKQRHTGIYIGNGQFIHASTSQGVTLSNLANPYWSNTYRQTRRVAEF